MAVMQKASANQTIREGKISLADAIKLVVNQGAELNPEYLDAQLIQSMKPEWPKERAVPLIYSQKKLIVGSPENSPALAKDLSALVNGTQVDIVQINKKSWERWGNAGYPVGQPITEEALAKPAKQMLGADLAATIEKIPTRSVSATDENSVGNDVRALMADAAKIGASDIHFEPTERYLIARFRIDGVLRDVCKYKCTAQDDYRKIIIARIKIIAHLNIAESRIPQDGRVTETLHGKRVDLRVSTLPTLHGEKCVIRLLPHENSFTELSDLGMPKEAIPGFEEWLARSQGMVLITGPTGSGKTSTLYTSLAKLLDISKNVVTVEDPVEFQLARVNQVQVNAKAGLTFASGLRSILRQDPDIIMIGEIRDLETAEISIQAALTGHLVLSTLHTNDAPSSITRMVDMGVQPYLIASSLIGVIAQRLVRRVCKDCCVEYTPSEEELKILGIKDGTGMTFVKPRGCQNCNDTGYSGRDGIFEIMPVGERMKNLVQDNAGLNKYKELLREMEVDSLFTAGVKKVIAHTTTVEELLRVVPPTQA